MTLRNYMNLHFFDSASPYNIICNGNPIQIGWDEYEKYEVIKNESKNGEDYLHVKEIK